MEFDGEKVIINDWRYEQISVLWYIVAQNRRLTVV